jgi:hypothetical protein
VVLLLLNEPLQIRVVDRRVQYALVEAGAGKARRHGGNA